MEHQVNPYRIRPARLEEAGRLREIEDEAGTRFAGLGLIDEELDVSFPLDDLARLVSMGQVWVTLSTFRDVPWNGPFYRKHGFRDLPPAEWTPGMRAIREKEAQHGLHVEARVFMRRDL